MTDLTEDTGAAKVLRKARQKLLTAINKIGKESDRCSQPSSPSTFLRTPRSPFLAKPHQEFWRNSSLFSSPTSSPPPIQRRRSSSICSLSIPETRQIIKESVAQGLPIIPFVNPSFVIVENCATEQKEYEHSLIKNCIPEEVQETLSSGVTPHTVRKKINIGKKHIMENKEKPWKKKEKTGRWDKLSENKILRDEWRATGTNRADYMLVDFSK